MLDTVGPELQVIKNSEKAITLKIDGFLTFTLNQDKKRSLFYSPSHYLLSLPSFVNYDNEMISYI
ncbi:hypothetical protein Bca4012_062862 [Brassica carinata]